MRFLLCLLLSLASAAQADDSVPFCYNYGCGVEAEVRFDARQMAQVREQLQGAADAADERRRLAVVLGSLYGWAGEQLPIRADKGGDYADDGVEGRMDCIDHATTTTRLLRLLEAHGWLRHHRVIEQARRSFLILQHFSAVIEQRVAPVAQGEAEPVGDWCVGCYGEGGSVFAGPQSRNEQPAPDPVMDARWAVDTWFRDNGAPAVVMPLATWLGGAYPDD